MHRRSKALLGGAAVLAGWIGWGLYSTWSTESVPYERLRTVDGIEIRQYPETVTVETTAPDERAAFQRLFRYISGVNVPGKSISMTTPVETQGESIPMTAPVRSESVDRADATTTGGADHDSLAEAPDSATSGGMRMAFSLPADYGPETAPEPIDPAVELRVEPATTMAVRPFSWFAPTRRVRRMERELLSTIQREGIAPVGEPFLLRYDAPWTPPFMRRNEVGVAVDRGDDASTDVEIDIETDEGTDTDVESDTTADPGTDVAADTS